MFARSNSKVALTFLCLVVALGLANVSEANSLVQSPRDHAQLNRMIKKRTVEQRGLFDFPPINGAAGDPTGTPSTDTTATTTTGTGSGTTTGVTTTTTSGATTTTDTNTTGTTTGTSITTGSGTTTDTTTTNTSTTSTSTTTTSTTPTSTTSPPTTTTQAPATTSPPDTDTQAETTQHTSTKFVTASQSSDSADPTSANSLGGLKDDNNNKITKTTLTVIVAVAASIGFVALAWTLFRKWKLRPSSNFDDRMQPIDWQPTGPEDSGIPTHRRAGSAASHGSFHSGDGHASGYGSNHGHGGLDPLPEHDFTATASLAPVGGYADLQRGPSPQPIMSELSRGPSMMHHQQPYAPAYNTGMRY